MSERKRVLITGAEGTIGSLLRPALAESYDVVAVTREPADFPSHVADIADLDAIRGAFRGIDTAIHLAATASVTAPWSDVLSSNIVGTYHVFEAARLAGVERIVFASSNHAVGGYEVDGAPDIYDPSDPRRYDHGAEIRPDSLYGVSKVFGEALGRLYSDRHGMRVVCLRIGSVTPDDDPSTESELEVAPERTPTSFDRRRRRAAVWLSHRDLVELVRCSLEADVRFAVVYGVSDNAGRFWDLDGARRLVGFVPRDGAPAPRP